MNGRFYGGTDIVRWSLKLKQYHSKIAYEFCCGFIASANYISLYMPIRLWCSHSKTTLLVKFVSAQHSLWNFCAFESPLIAGVYRRFVVLSGLSFCARVPKSLPARNLRRRSWKIKLLDDVRTDDTDLVLTVERSRSRSRSRSDVKTS